MIRALCLFAEEELADDALDAMINSEIIVKTREKKDKAVLRPRITSEVLAAILADEDE